MENAIPYHLLCNKTPAHPCGYLPGQQAVTNFMPLENVNGLEQFSKLNAEGYRRSGAYIYRPACPTCSACISLRVPSETFIPNKSQKRCWKRNSDLTVSIHRAAFTQERYALYEHYISSRHADGDMFPPSKQQFTDFLCEGTLWCSFYEFREADGTLIAVTAVDRLNHGVAILYTFFQPELSQRSLGTYSILWLINYAKKYHLAYVYLGYWIKKCDKMSYKCKFKPHELLKQGLWTSSN